MSFILDNILYILAGSAALLAAIAALMPKSSRFVKSVFGSTVFRDNIKINGTLEVDGILTSNTTPLGGSTDSTFATDSSGDIAQYKVVVKDDAGQARLGRAIAQYSESLVGISTAAESAGTVATHTAPGFAVDGLTAASANKKYYAGKDGSLVDEDDIGGELAGSVGKKLEVGFSDNASNFIWLPKTIESAGAGEIFWLDLTSPSGLTPKVGITATPFTRGSERSYWDRGVLKFAEVNQPRFETDVNGNSEGLRLDPQTQNYLTRNRELSHADWTKTTCTATRDATGIDLVANSATTLTATAGNATCASVDVSVSLAAGYAIYSAYFKRKTGSGTIEFSTDGGAAYNTIAVTSTSDWVRHEFTHSNATVAQIVIRIVTSGDEIEVDFTQAEKGVTYPSSQYAEATRPIWCRTAATATAVEQVIFNSAGEVNTFGGAVYVNARFCPNPSLNPKAMVISGSNGTQTFMSQDTSGTGMESYIGAATTTLTSSITYNQFDAFTAAWRATTSPQLQLRRLTNTPTGNTQTSSTYLTAAGWTFSGFDQIRLGKDTSGAIQAQINIKEVKVLNHFPSSTEDIYLGGA